MKLARPQKESSWKATRVSNLPARRIPTAILATKKPRIRENLVAWSGWSMEIRLSCIVRVFVRIYGWKWKLVVNRFEESFEDTCACIFLLLNFIFIFHSNFHTRRLESKVLFVRNFDFNIIYRKDFNMRMGQVLERLLFSRVIFALEKKKRINKNRENYYYFYSGTQFIS